jgi:hypothetical protein
MFTFTAAAYNLVRIRNLMHGAPTAAVCLKTHSTAPALHFQREQPATQEGKERRRRQIMPVCARFSAAC